MPEPEKDLEGMMKEIPTEKDIESEGPTNEERISKLENELKELKKKKTVPAYQPREFKTYSPKIDPLKGFKDWWDASPSLERFASVFFPLGFAVLIGMGIYSSTDPKLREKMKEVNVLQTQQASVEYSQSSSAESIDDKVSEQKAEPTNTLYPTETPKPVSTTINLRFGNKEERKVVIGELNEREFVNVHYKIEYLSPESENTLHYHSVGYEGSCDSNADWMPGALYPGGIIQEYNNTIEGYSDGICGLIFESADGMPMEIELTFDRGNWKIK